MIDGSQLLNASWTLKSGSSCIYESSPIEDTVPWQLWLDTHTVLTPARWPNAKLSDLSVFTAMSATGEGPLAYSDRKSDKPDPNNRGKLLTLIDDGTHNPSLRDAMKAIDFTDTLAVQSFGSLYQYTTGSRVKSTDAASGSLTYTIADDFDWTHISTRPALESALFLRRTSEAT